MLPDSVACWHLAPDAIGQADLDNAYDHILCPDERARCDKIPDAVHRRFYLCGRSLARLALSHAAKIDRISWRFGIAAGGKPAIFAPPGLPFRFNLSHTNGLVVCAVVVECEIGIDVEQLDRPGNLLGLAERVLAAGELEDLRACPADEQRGRFLEYWTLKEAYLKARGIGLSVAPRQLAFSLGPRIRLNTGATRATEEGDWEFIRIRPTEKHIVAIAVDRRRPNAESLPIQVIVHDGIGALEPDLH